MTTDSLPLLLEPSELAANLHREDICIVDLCSEQSYESGHIPGAVHLPIQSLVSGHPPAPGKLPDKEHLERIFSFLGLTENTHFVAYDDEGGGWAGRFIWTLDVIGHTKYSYLNGGLIAWRGDSLEIEVDSHSRQATSPSITIHREAIAEAADILANLDRDNYVVWDARSPAEYRGERVLAAKGGHIPGAINCEWTSLMDPDRNFRIREDAEERLALLGIRKGQEIVTHCQSHHRSSFTYLVGKTLNFNIRGYHGSWSEWGNLPDTPVEETLL